MPEKVNNFKKHESFLLRALVQLHILIQRGIELVFRWIAMFCGRVSWSGRFGLLLVVNGRDMVELRLVRRQNIFCFGRDFSGTAGGFGGKQLSDTTGVF